MFDDLRFDALRCLYYHGDREAYLKRLDKLIKVLLAVLVTGTCAKVLGLWAVNEMYFALGLSLLTAIHASCGLEKKAEEHASAKEQFDDILNEIATRPMTKALKARLVSKTIKLCGKSSNVWRATNILAFNKAVDTLAADDSEREAHYKRLKCYHVWFRNVFVFHRAEFPNLAHLKRADNARRLTVVPALPSIGLSGKKLAS